MIREGKLVKTRKGTLIMIKRYFSDLLQFYKRNWKLIAIIMAIFAVMETACLLVMKHEQKIQSFLNRKAGVDLKRGNMPLRPTDQSSEESEDQDQSSEESED